jgi:hypothetical protein
MVVVVGYTEEMKQGRASEKKGGFSEKFLKPGSTDLIYTFS